MSDLRRHCDWLLRVYPASYRTLRDSEIRETLFDLSRPGAAWPPLREATAIVTAGLRRRLGFAADQPLGGLVELIAGWYLLLAVTLAALALLIGEWAPWATQRLRPPFGFGPFATDGMPVYALAVLTGLAWWVGRPAMARALAAITFASAVAMIALEHLVPFWGRPPLSFVIPLLACLTPTMVRPAVGERRPHIDDHAVAALATISAAAAAVWFAAVDVYLAHKYRYAQFWTGRGPDFYRLIVASVARWVPLVGVAALVAAVGLLIIGRRAVAIGVTALMAPWLLLAVLVAGSLTGSSLSGSTFSAVATGAPTALAVTAGFAALALWLTAIRPSPPTTVADY